MSMSRRDFLKVSAAGSGGLMLSLSLAGCSGFRTNSSGNDENWEPDAWLELTPDNDIYFTLARVEMGQGTYTGLTTLIAEELEVHPEAIQPRFAPVAPEYRNPLYKLQLTGGSTSLATSWQPLRQAGASARLMLVNAAAKVWKVDAGQCTVADGQVFHPNGSDSLSYGKLVQLASRESTPSDVTLKKASEWKYIGKKSDRLDAEPKSTGQPIYGIDVEREGMVYAVVSRSPRHGGKVASFDASQARSMPGVLDIFEIERGIAVVAGKYWRARKAQDALTIEWDYSDALSVNTPQTG